MSDFALQVETLRPQLLRFARTQLRNEAWAEDAVSESVIAALERPAAFAGQSQLKYRDITLGTVKALSLSPDHRGHGIQLKL